MKKQNQSNRKKTNKKISKIKRNRNKKVSMRKRNMERPRKLNPELVEESWNDVQKNKIYFQGLFGNANFMMVDNSNTLSEKQATKKFNMLVKKGIGSFIKKPVKNYRGKKWVERQLILKGIK